MSRFTVVFEGDAKAIPRNPFHVESPFGKPLVISLGDVTAINDDLIAALEQILAETGDHGILKIAGAALDKAQATETA